jgi:RNA polymerase sigma-70 factor (ECF subfamily)
MMTGSGIGTPEAEFGILDCEFHSEAVILQTDSTTPFSGSAGVQSRCYVFPHISDIPTVQRCDVSILLGLFMNPSIKLPESRLESITSGESDEALAAHVRGNPDAFAELYQRCVLRIYRYHLVRTGNPQDAQDLTTQTFLAALERLDGYRGQGSFIGWLFGIASHKVADHFRKRREHLSLESVEVVCHPDPLPEEWTATSLQMEQVVQALRRLSPERAEALVLRIVGGLSAAEVGRVMGKSPEATRMLVHRGLRDLKTILLPIPEVEQ